MPNEEGIVGLVGMLCGTIKINVSLFSWPVVGVSRLAASFLFGSSQVYVLLYRLPVHYVQEPANPMHNFSLRHTPYLNEWALILRRLHYHTYCL
jgi:hypothetical protein